uniref:Uncharacterized protein n=1 Tax=Anopheles coluzzii TaxID=1518534 RepID=A0A8W7PH94_ANOCL
LFDSCRGGKLSSNKHQHEHGGRRARRNCQLPAGGQAVPGALAAESDGGRALLRDRQLGRAGEHGPAVESGARPADRRGRHRRAARAAADRQVWRDGRHRRAGVSRRQASGGGHLGRNAERAGSEPRVAAVVRLHPHVQPARSAHERRGAVGLYRRVRLRPVPGDRGRGRHREHGGGRCGQGDPDDPRPGRWRGPVRLLHLPGSGHRRPAVRRDRLLRHAGREQQAGVQRRDVRRGGPGPEQADLHQPLSQEQAGGGNRAREWHDHPVGHPEAVRCVGAVRRPHHPRHGHPVREGGAGPDGQRGHGRARHAVDAQQLLIPGGVLHPEPAVPPEGVQADQRDRHERAAHDLRGRRGNALPVGHDGVNPASIPFCFIPRFTCPPIFS